MKFINKLRNNLGHAPTPERKSCKPNVKDVNFRLVWGQVMVEAIVAMSVVVIGLLSVFTLTSTSIGINRVDADRYVAINLAKEGIELVKNLLDRNIVDDTPWNNLPGFVPTVSFYEIDYNDSELSDWNPDHTLFFGKNGGGYKYDEDVVDKDTPTSFSRQITIDNRDGGPIVVTSTVYWQSKGDSYNFSIKDYFYDLKELKGNLLIL